MGNVFAGNRGRFGYGKWHCEDHVSSGNVILLLHRHRILFVKLWQQWTVVETKRGPIRFDNSLLWMSWAWTWCFGLFVHNKSNSLLISLCEHLNSLSDYTMHALCLMLPLPKLSDDNKSEKVPNIHKRFLASVYRTRASLSTDGNNVSWIAKLRNIQNEDNLIRAENNVGCRKPSRHYYSGQPKLSVSWTLNGTFATSRIRTHLHWYAVARSKEQRRASCMQNLLESRTYESIASNRRKSRTTENERQIVVESCSHCGRHWPSMNSIQWIQSNRWYQFHVGEYWFSLTKQLNVWAENNGHITFCSMLAVTFQITNKDRLHHRLLLLLFSYLNNNNKNGKKMENEILAHVY